ncbi:hypothetical protein SWI_00757 [Staphylococcus aureus M0045]|nr:hypothetical protein SWI_00757 [Staphylococcus aureus M0045]
MSNTNKQYLPPKFQFNIYDTPYKTKHNGSASFYKTIL